MFGEWIDKLAIDAKATKELVLEDMFFDEFKEIWTSTDEIMAWTRDIVLE